MKKIFSALFFTLFGAAALMTSCSDVPAPYEIKSPDDVDLVGTGTKEDPYNVATAQMKQDGSVAWVQGYIVGVMETNVDPFTANFAAPFSTSSNLMIADNPDEEKSKNCLMVQLPTGDIRTALNLVDHADNLKQPVILQGTLTSYFSAAGLKDVSAGVFKGEEIGGEQEMDGAYINESFKTDLGVFTSYSVEGSLKWENDYSSAMIKGGSATGKFPSDTWLVAKSVDLSKEDKAYITFDHAINYASGATLSDYHKLVISKDYDGSGVAGIKNAHWDEIAVKMPSGSSFDFVNTGKVAVPAEYLGQGKVTVALHYISTSEVGTTWEVQNFVMAHGDADGGQQPGEDDPFGLNASNPQTEFVADFEEISENNQVYAKEGWINKALGKGNPWQTSLYNADKYLKINTYKTESGDQIESWFITPAFTVNSSSKLTFDCAGANWSSDMHLKVFFLQKGADGIVTQEEIVVSDIPTSGENYVWAKDLNIALDKYVGKVGFVGFQYTMISTGAFSSLPTYQIDNVKLTSDGGTEPEPGKADLFISEYVEGSSLNKYIEIYNPTDQTVDLSGYTLAMHNYSKDGEGGNDSGIKSVTLTGTLAPKQVVVYKNSKATLYTGDAKTITNDKGDHISDEVMNFNGNDPIILYKGSDKIIDYFGVDNTGFGKDMTFRRKSSVTGPSATYNADEWEATSKDDVSGLGSHTMN